MDYCSSQPIPAHAVQISSSSALVVVIKPATIALIIITPLARWKFNLVYPSATALTTTTPFNNTDSIPGLA
jgi:hypothetical protein